MSQTTIAPDQIRPPRKRGRRRRPSGEPPPLPRPLSSSGKVMLILTGGVFALLLAVAFTGTLGMQLDRYENSLLREIAEFRTPLLTSIAQGLNSFLTSPWLLVAIEGTAVVSILAFRRFRHQIVFGASILLVVWVTSAIAETFIRARPYGLEIEGEWAGATMPSRPLAFLAAACIAFMYSAVVPGRPRNTAKNIAGAMLFTAAGARLFLGIDHPTDIALGLVLGVTIPLVAFRYFTPNDVFPVRYRQGKTAHLDIEGPRGEAIRTALQEQLGITVTDMKPFNLAGSAGSTPLRLRTENGPAPFLFAKLYASTHLRADRWYKLGRTLLYGRLEDESSFSTVRRLVQYEDYLMRVMRESDICAAQTYGFIEITPEREYMLVTEFIDGAEEILEAEVTDEVIDAALKVVRDLWDAGIAHRDVKPSNILVKDERVYLIDVAFGEVRPSAWRQAVDLANMMLVLALRTDPDRVYQRALSLFDPEDIAEAFAATRGVTIPSQSRGLMKKDVRDLVGRFRELAPKRKPIKIQRWSIRRVGLTFGVLFLAWLGVQLAFANLKSAGLLTPNATRDSFAVISREPACDAHAGGEMLLLAAQAVPTATKIPCLAALPPGWTFDTMNVRSGGADMWLTSDRAGAKVLQVSLSRSCDISGASEVPTDELDAKRYERVNALDNRYEGTRYYVFPGGCVTYNFDIRGEGRTAIATEASLAVDLLSRQALDAELHRETGLRL